MNERIQGTDGLGNRTEHEVVGSTEDGIIVRPVTPTEQGTLERLSKAINALSEAAEKFGRISLNHERGSLAATRHRVKQSEGLVIEHQNKILALLSDSEGSEPVAWRHRWVNGEKRGHWTFEQRPPTEGQLRDPTTEIQEVYTRPAPVASTERGEYAGKMRMRLVSRENASMVPEISGTGRCREVSVALARSHSVMEDSATGPGAPSEQSSASSPTRGGQSAPTSGTRSRRSGTRRCHFLGGGEGCYEPRMDRRPLMPLPLANPRRDNASQPRVETAVLLGGGHRGGAVELGRHPERYPPVVRLLRLHPFRLTNAKVLPHRGLERRLNLVNRSASKGDQIARVYGATVKPLVLRVVLHEPEEPLVTESLRSSHVRSLVNGLGCRRSFSDPRPLQKSPNLPDIRPRCLGLVRAGQNGPHVVELAREVRATGPLVDHRPKRRQKRLNRCPPDVRRSRRSEDRVQRLLVLPAQLGLLGHRPGLPLVTSPSDTI